MLLLWDETYFTRVWCIFEVAVYLSLNTGGHIQFVPIALGCSELVLTLGCSFGMLLAVVAFGVNAVSACLAFFLGLGVPWFIVLPMSMVSLVWLPCVGSSYGDPVHAKSVSWQFLPTL